MESRELIIDILSKEITKQITQNFLNLNKIENFLENYNKFFSISEIKEYQNKISLLRYLTFSSKNIELNIFYILDIKNFLVELKEKKKRFLKKIYEECINSIQNYELFYNFVFKSEFYFIDNKYFFKEEEIKKYNELWFDLEIENALILSDSDNDKIKIEKRWDTNYENILKQIEKMLSYLDTLI